MFTTLAILSAPLHPVGPWAWGGWWFLLIPLFWILLFAVIFAIAGRRWRRHGWGHGYGHPGFGPHAYWGGQAARSAEASLAERFAQGDIDEKEYRARLEVLRANAFPGQAGQPPHAK